MEEIKRKRRSPSYYARKKQGRALKKYWAENPEAKLRLAQSVREGWKKRKARITSGEPVRSNDYKVVVKIVKCRYCGTTLKGE